MSPSPKRSRRDPRVIAIGVIGLLISALMVARSQVHGDQLNMLTRGWLLAFAGEIVPVGMPMSGGGFVPGSLTSLLVGLPLVFWKHHRAATLVVFVLHGLGYVLLDRVMRTTLTREERFLFALLYWLSPWRLFYSGYLWTPNYMPFVGAAHTWTIFKQRRRPSFWLSVAHIGTLGIALQLHPSSLLLMVCSGLLLWRRYLRIHLGGAVLGGLLTAMSLIPWFLFVAAEPQFLPFGGAVPTEWWRLLAVPLLRGGALLLRYSSLMVGTSFLCFDFSDLPALATFGSFGGFIVPAQLALGLATVPLAIWAQFRLWRRQDWRRLRAAASDRTWLQGFVRWSIVGALLTFAISPTTIMNWQALAFLHVAVLPLVLLGGALWRSRRRRHVSLAAAAWTAAAVALGLTMALASSPYRCAPENCGSSAFYENSLRANHPMLVDLEIQATCEIIVDDPEGWWPDILPDEPGKPWYRVESEQTSGWRKR